jgi:hypothetical protein
MIKPTYDEPGIRRRAFVSISVIISILIISLLSLAVFYRTADSGTYAYIYQDGDLIETINLTQVSESYSFDVEGENDTYNTIEVRSGEIGIIASSCPDSLCRKMGFIHNNLIPVTCLPNKLVIKVVSDESTGGSMEPDGVTY